MDADGVIGIIIAGILVYLFCTVPIGPISPGMQYIIGYHILGMNR
jgi:hypothetical protein